MKNPVHKTGAVRAGESPTMQEVREQLGQLWGLNRPLTRVELARALKLSPKNGGDYLSRMEKEKKPISGTMEVAIKAFLWGYKPDNMDDLITPGYPRGPVR
jgi:hypothetical protein